ncbi:MAG TPA: M48 family metallopeptidase [Candidatus Angelobacter sp.]|nr:M48 family metallopeptidase [Candidatus Angelobacter sp.]
MTAPGFTGKIGAGVNELNPGYEAGLFHPDMGNEVVNGRVFLDRWKLYFRSESVSEEMPMETLEVEFEDGGTRIYFKDPERPDLSIFTSDQSILKHPAMRHAAQAQAQMTQVLSKREANRALRLTAYFLVFCVVATWFCSVSLGFMVRTIASWVPMEWEQKFGQKEIAKLRSEGMLIDDTNQIAQVTEIAQPLIKVLPENRRDLKFYILDDEDANAFALPGEYVVIHKGLLQMVDTREELLGVLAHELAHETQRHMIRHTIAAEGSLAVFGVFIHSKRATGSLLGMGSGILVSQDFSRSYESEADAVGWKYLVAANIDPRGMIEVFKKLKAEEDAMGFSHLMPQSLASHPALSKRIAVLQKKWNKLDRKTGFLQLPPLPWPKATNADESRLPVQLRKLMRGGR